MVYFLIVTALRACARYLQSLTVKAKCFRLLIRVFFTAQPSMHATAIGSLKLLVKTEKTTSKTTYYDSKAVFVWIKMVFIKTLRMEEGRQRLEPWQLVDHIQQMILMGLREGLHGTKTPQ